MKTILLSVSGMSPAIVTETVWGLSRETPAVIPDEVIVITTTRGEADLRRQLSTPAESWGGRSVWETLRHEVLTRAGSDPESDPRLQLALRILERRDLATGIRALADDVRSPADNREAADFILQSLAALVEAADHRVIASIAGGRKTMGALLYAAMSLIGRETDRITHVLVSDPFETCKGFFYPDQPVQDLVAGPPGKEVPVRAETATIDLADVPFVPLRNVFTELRKPRLSFAGLVEQYSRATREPSGPPELAIDEARQTLIVDGREVRLAGRTWDLAHFLWEHARAGQAPFAYRDLAADAWKAWADRRRPGPAPLKCTWSVEDVSKALNELRAALRERGLDDAIPYLAPERKRIGFRPGRLRLTDA